MMKRVRISPRMQQAIDEAKRNGNSLHRWPGGGSSGCWFGIPFDPAVTPQKMRGCGFRQFNTGTISALIDRRAAVVVERLGNGQIMTVTITT